MHPLGQALLSTWDIRPVILIILITAALLYVRGWRQLRQRSARPRLASWPRLLAYLSGLLVLAISLFSPIDALGSQLFFMHMLQHLLSIMVAAPLLWLGSPFPIMLWSLPPNVRRFIASLFVEDSPFRRRLAWITRPAFSWLIFITVYLGWHDPTLYGLALRSAWVHDLQHITFFAVAMLYWWHAIGAGPRIHGRFPAWAKMIYLLVTVPPNMIIGVSIAFSSVALYTYYESVPRIWGYSVMQDQMLSGVIMWIPGSMMFIVAALIVLAAQFKDRSPARTSSGPLPASEGTWDRPEQMIAPGLEHRVIQNRWKSLHVNGSQASDEPKTT